jgi:hypothetical protein
MGPRRDGGERVLCSDSVRQSCEALPSPGASVPRAPHGCRQAGTPPMSAAARRVGLFRQGGRHARWLDTCLGPVDVVYTQAERVAPSAGQGRRDSVHAPESPMGRAGRSLVRPFTRSKSRARGARP